VTERTAGLERARDARAARIRNDASDGLCPISSRLRPVEPKSTPEGRFLLAFEMAEFGIALMRANLRRRFPDAPDAEVAIRLATWIEGPDPSDQDMKCIAWPR
jgi:hypothetical protein